MKTLVAVLVIALAAVLIWRYAPGKQSTSSTNNSMNPKALIKTTMGDIEIELFADKTPVTVDNFVKLADTQFYDDVLFHRVIPNFMIQTGDPNTKTSNEATYGMGGPGYSIPDEFVSGLSNVTGTVSMANAGPGTGGSQFFINVADNTYLDGKHTVFGKVTKGMSVAIAISQVPRNERDLPSTPVRIDSITIEK